MSQSVPVRARGTVVTAANCGVAQQIDRLAVPDRSTATLMQSFYQSLLTQHLRPETALTLAMRQMQRQGPRDPVFWAPFTATLAALH